MMWIYCVTGLLSVLFSVPVHGVGQQVLAKALYTHLFNGYDRNLIPICTEGGNVTLDMDLALRQIMELSEREQLLSSNIWLRMRWNDCRLQWDPSNYGNLTYLMVNYDDVWVPDITLYDSAADENMFPGREDYRVYISSTGSLTYNFPTVTKSICRVKVKYFPFDTQECPLQFGSWSHHGFDLDIVNRNPTGDLDSYVENTEWTVTKIPITRHVLYYNCCPEPYPDVTFYITMERRPDFYLLTMLFPCILTSAVAALSFLLPVESGEKVSLEITVLLSLAVFLLLVSESLPPSSEDFPIIGSYFASAMVLVTLSLLQTVIVLNVFYRGTNGRRVPRWAKVIFLQHIGKILCIRSNRVDTFDKTEEERGRREHMFKTLPPIKLSDMPRESVNSSSNDDDEHANKPRKNGHIPTGNTNTNFKNNGLLPSFVRDNFKLETMKQQTKHLQNIEDQLSQAQMLENVNYEWRDISNVLDRLFLVLYMLIFIITSLAFLMQCV